METILKYDRVVLTKELNDKFRKIGDVYEVASILDNSFVLRDSKTRVAVGVVGFEDFEKHFVHEENFKGWTNWTPLTGFDGQTDALYRTNRRKVVVKFLTDKVRAESCCHKDDDFNLYFGLQMAYMRCLNKALEKRREEYERVLKEINREICDNRTTMKRMVSSLERE